MAFQKWTYMYAGKDNLKFVEAVFEKPDGSNQKYSCEKFWGLRSCDGLYRSFPFENGSVKSVAYRLKMVSDDYYYWETSRMSIYFNPDRLWTKVINGPVVDHEKISEKAKQAGACLYKAYHKKGYTID